MLLLFDLDDTLYDKTGQIPPNFTEEHIRNIFPFFGVKELLTSTNHTKVLVTKGDPQFQHKKINILGLSQLFDQIMVCATNLEKGDCFAKAMQQYKTTPKEVIVIGNRIDAEIQEGNKLGCITILLNHGKYSSLKPEHESQIPQHTINDFSQLLSLIEKLHP